MAGFTISRRTGARPRLAHLLPLLVLATLAATSRADAAVKRMFVTSAHGNANLGLWPVIAGQGKSGAEAGDAICQTLANAHIDNPGTFRAWLSVTGDDAFCRVRTPNGAGTKSGRCGVDVVAFSLLKAGPWVRTDGQPFSLDEVALTGQGAVMTPAVRDETGATVDTVFARAWTGTDNNGVASAGRCGDWTSPTSAADTTVGELTATTGRWSDFGLETCDQDFHLLCFETGTDGSRLPPFESPGALAFVTSSSGTGDLSTWPGAIGTGSTAGDAICHAAARQAHLPWPDSFVAWLSTTTVDAIDRLDIDGPWKRVDGVKVASSKQNLIVSHPFGSLNVDENGDFVGEQVWTGSTGFGTAAPDTCADWTSADDSGYSGNSQSVLQFWASNGTHPCAEALPHHLYCFSDVVIDFWDEFERGIRRWSAKSP